MDYRDFQRRVGLDDRYVVDCINGMGRRFMELMQKQRMEIPIGFEEDVFYRRMVDAIWFYGELLQSLGKNAPIPLNLKNKDQDEELLEFKEVDYLKTAQPPHKTDELVLKNIDGIREITKGLLDKQRKGLPFTEPENELFHRVFMSLIALWEVQDERNVRTYRYSDVY